MKTIDKAIANRIEEEHTNLRKLMLDVCNRFAHPPNGNFAEWKLDLVWALRDLRNALVKHFDLEEDGGFMDDVVTQAPHEKKRVDELESEHAYFLREIDDIAFTVKDMDNPEELADPKDRLALLVDELHEHEASERELIGNVYYQDLGALD